MKRKLLQIVLFMTLLSGSVYSQTILDYKVKNQANSTERTKIIDIIRANLYQDYRQEFVFVVNKLNVSSNYAWFEGDVQRKDGRKVVVNDMDDCCHVEALLKKSGSKWYIVEIVPFSTDVWWDGIWNRTGAPKRLFFY
jgi:hypothetical protein